MMKAKFKCFLIEILADHMHDVWADWTRYFLSNLEDENVTRWKRQIETPYSELFMKEKDSDRRQAEAILDLLMHFGVDTDSLLE